MSRNAPSLTGEKATAGYMTLSLGGIFKTTVALMPMFDTPEQARPTRNNVCVKHSKQVKQAWECPECKGTPEQGTKKVVQVDGVGMVDAPDTDWNSLGVTNDPTLSLGAWVQKIDSVFFDGKSYFMFPNEKKEVDGYLIIMELLREEGGYLLATTQGDHGTARILAVSYHEPTGFLVGEHCHHRQYLRVEKAARLASVIDAQKAAAPPPAAHIKIARGAFGALPRTFDLEVVTDTLGNAQWNYIKKKAKEMGHILITEPPDLMEALKASSAALRAPRRKPSKPKGGVKV